MISRVGVMTGVLLLLCATAVCGQRPAGLPTVDSGKVVRAWLPSGELRGRLLIPLTAGMDSVLYCMYPGPPCTGLAERTRWLQLGAAQHLDVQVGTRAGKGAWIGGVYGGLMGLLGACGKGLYSGGPGPCPRSLGEQAFAVIASTATMGAVGAIIGSGFPRFQRIY